MATPATFEMTGPVWIALIVLVFALLYKLFLYVMSRWYRDVYLSGYTSVDEGVFVPNEWNVVRTFYSFQPMYNSTRYRMFVDVPTPIKYIWVYLSAILSCIFLIIGMSCSASGGCETYAWLYVALLSVIFVVDMIKTLYDYANWRQTATDVKVKYAN
jgi:hypothetical protein